MKAFTRVIPVLLCFSAFAQAPKITSFTPGSGPVGISVAITGTNFNATAANNVVYFGAVRATVTVASTTSLTVTVPTGATYQPVSVLNTASDLTGYSSKPFITTFTNPFGTGIPANYYKTKVDFTTGMAPVSVALSDVDGDGKPDLVTANRNSGTVSVFRNISTTGSITASSFAAKVDFTTELEPISVAPGDVDGDGKPDLIVANYGSNTVSVFRNTSTTGSITSSSFAAKADFTTGGNPRSVALGDMDGDGKPDLVTANLNSNTISVLRNTSTAGSIIASSFAAKIDFANSLIPYSVALGDVDGDGKPEVLTVNNSSNTVSVFRNTSTTGSITASSFAVKVDFATGASPRSVAIGDVDGDGKPDLITANISSDNLSVSRNTSTMGSITASSFAAKVDFATGSFPQSVALGDADGDGKPDLITANGGSNTASVLRNTSTAGSITASSFTTKVDFTTGTSPVSVAIGDVDGDGKPDLVTANVNFANVSVLEMGTAPPPTITSFTPSSGPVGTPVTITGTNFNVTAANNVVYFGAVRATVTAASATSLTVTSPAGATYQPISVLNNTTGLTGYSSKPFITTFINPFGTGIPANYYKPKVDFTTGSAPYSVAIGDVDGDGKPDVVVANSNSSSVSVFRNISTTGSITASSFATKVDFATGTSQSVALGDVDGDGKPDLVVTNFYSNTVSVFRNTSVTGSITASSFAAKVDFATGGFPESVAIGDVDGDGKPDLIVANYGSNIVSVFRNTSVTGSITTSSFAAKVDFATSGFPSSVAIGDVDDDGKPDLVTANSNSNTVSILRNTAAVGSITASSFASKVDFTTGTTPESVAIGDVDGDGKPDLVVANRNSSTVSVLRNTSAAGSITPSSFAAKVDFTTGGISREVAIGDADGDGKPDLLTVNEGSSSVSVFRNLSSTGSITASSFAAKVDFAIGTLPYSVALGDVDGDGKPEVVTAIAGSSTVSVLQVGVPVITYYPRTTATDLSQVSNWTDAVSGMGGISPSNFTSPNQIFNVSNNVAKPNVLGAWTISGGSNLMLNNTDSLIFRPAASLTIGSGSMADFKGKPVTLKSTAAGTAYIGQITGTLTNATNVTVERYLSSLNNRAYRLLAPSVNTTTSIRQNWQEGVNNPNTSTNFNPVPGYGTHITGSQSGTGGFDATSTGQGSLFTIDPTTGYQYISNTDVNALSAKTGYLIYLRGDRSIDLHSTVLPLPTSNTTLRATGTLLTGAQTFTGTVGNTGAGTGFNLVTNPYASAINWQSVYSANTGLAQAYTLFDPNTGGSQGGYVTVNTMGIKSNPSSNANLNIQSGQAFFVQATGATPPVVNIQEAHKSTVNNVDVFRTGAQSEIFTSSLFYRDQFNNRINADGVTSVYNNAYDTAVDEADAEQIANFDEDVAIRRSGHDLSIESRPLIDMRDTIPFAVARLQTRPYEWQFNASNFNAPGLTAYLLDRFLNTQTPVSLSGTTVVAFTVTSNPVSSAANRFAVVFVQGVNTPLPISGLTVKAHQKDKNVEVEWTAQSEVNLDRYEVEKSTDARQFGRATSVTAGNAGGAAAYNWIDGNAARGANYYRIKASGTSGETKYSNVVRVDIGKATYGIAVYPNPVTDGAVSLNMNLPKGAYTVTLTNAVGQQVYKSELTHPGGSATQSLPLSAGLAQGVYRLSVSDGGENRHVQQLIKQ